MDFLPAVFLDVTGCERVFGGLGNLAEQVAEAMGRLRLAARVAVAPTIGAAWALAAYGEQNGVIIQENQIRQAISPLPPLALRIDGQIAGALFHLGIETIGQLLALPRSALPARFGPELLRRIDQALGRTPEPLNLLEYHAPIEARMDFDGVIGQFEAIWLATKQLIERLVIDMKRRGVGARKIEMEFFRAYGEPIRKTIMLSRASRDGKKMFNLMRCAMEDERRSDEGAQPQATKRRRGGTKARRHDGTEGNNESCGYVGLGVYVPVFERITDEQVLMMDQQEQEGLRELDDLLERLALRMGEEGVAQARLAQSYVPERAYCEVGCASAHVGAGAACAEAHPTSLRARPLTLFAQPAEVRVMVSPSDDRDGRPVVIAEDGHIRRVVHAVGPERIAGEWWEGHNKTRDYFAVEDEGGRRSWVFRVMETGRWFVHGEFE